MNYALQNQVRQRFARELDAIGRRSRSRLHDPRAAALIPRPFTLDERRARAEYAETVVANVRALRGPDWRRGELEQWIERVWCMSAGFAEGAAAAIPLGPVDVMGGSTTNIVGYLQGELGVSIGTGVSAWASQYGGTTLDHAQGTGGNQPSREANNALFWGRSTVTGDGSNDFMVNTWDPPAPGTTSSYFRFVTSRSSHAANARLTSGLSIRGGATSNTVRAVNNNTGSDVAMSLDTVYRVEALFSNQVTDYLKVGASTPTAENAGNTNPAGGAESLFATTSGSAPSTHSISKYLLLNVAPTDLQRAIFDGIDLAFYNGNITL